MLVRAVSARERLARRRRSPARRPWTIRRHVALRLLGQARRGGLVAINPAACSDAGSEIRQPAAHAVPRPRHWQRYVASERSS